MAAGKPDNQTKPVRYVLRRGMVAPEAGQVIVEDGRSWRITKASGPLPPTDYDTRLLSARPERGDFIVEVEMEPEPRPRPELRADWQPGQDPHDSAAEHEHIWVVGSNGCVHCGKPYDGRFDYLHPMAGAMGERVPLSAPLLDAIAELVSHLPEGPGKAKLHIADIEYTTEPDGWGRVSFMFRRIHE